MRQMAPLPYASPEEIDQMLDDIASRSADPLQKTTVFVYAAAKAIAKEYREYGSTMHPISEERIAKILLQHAEQPAVEPADKTYDLPTAPGRWTRYGREFDLREMLDDPGTWRLRAFYAKTGAEVEWSMLRGGWQKSEPEGESVETQMTGDTFVTRMTEENDELRAALAAVDKELGNRWLPADRAASVRVLCEAHDAAKQQVEKLQAKLTADQAELAKRGEVIVGGPGVKLESGTYAVYLPSGNLSCVGRREEDYETTDCYFYVKIPVRVPSQPAPHAHKCGKCGCDKPATTEGYIGSLKCHSCERHAHELTGVLGEPCEGNEEKQSESLTDFARVIGDGPSQLVYGRDLKRLCDILLAERGEA